LEQAFLEDVVNRLELTGATYAITGSIASTFWGILRTTHDVDIVLVLSGADVAQMVAAFSDSYYISDLAVQDAVQRSSMFNVVDFSTGLKADLWVTKGDPFNIEMLSRRRRVELVPGRQAWMGSPEDVLLHKLVWNTITLSERQLADAAGIAAVQGGSLDLAYMRGWAARQGTSQELEDVLQGKYLKSS
jgi:hypothetical protein